MASKTSDSSRRSFVTKEESEGFFSKAPKENKKVKEGKLVDKAELSFELESVDRNGDFFLWKFEFEGDRDGTTASIEVEFRKGKKGSEPFAAPNDKPKRFESISKREGVFAAKIKKKFTGKFTITREKSVLQAALGFLKPPAEKNVRVTIVRVPAKHLECLQTVRKGLSAAEGLSDMHPKKKFLLEACKAAKDIIFKAQSMTSTKTKATYDAQKSKIEKLCKQLDRDGGQAWTSKNAPVTGHKSATWLLSEREREFRNKKEKESRVFHKTHLSDNSEYAYLQWSALDPKKSNIVILLLSDWTSDHKRFLDLQLKGKTLEKGFIGRLRKCGRVVMVRWPFDPSLEKTDKDTFDATVLKNEKIMRVYSSIVGDLRRNRGGAKTGSTKSAGAKRTNPAADFIIPLSIAHAGWIGIRLRKRFPRVIPAVAFKDWANMDASCPSDVTNFLKSKKTKDDADKARKALNLPEETPLDCLVKICEQVQKSYKEFGTPNKKLAELVKISSEQKGLQKLKVLKIGGDEKKSLPWLDRKKTTEEVVKFFNDMTLPPVPPNKPGWNEKVGTFTWNSNSSAKDQTNRILFFLLPETKDEKESKAMFKKFNKAIDEGAESESKILEKGVKVAGGAVAVAASAWLISVTLTAGIGAAGAAGYGAYKAIRRNSTSAGPPDVSSIDRNLCLCFEASASNTATSPLLSVIAEKIKGNAKRGPLLPGRQYAVCATCETEHGESAFGNRTLWTCPAAPTDKLTIRNLTLKRDGRNVRLSWGDDAATKTASSKSSEDSAGAVRYELYHCEKRGYTDLTGLARSGKTYRIFDKDEVVLDNLRRQFDIIFQVRAINAGGPGPWSDEFTVDHVKPIKARGDGSVFGAALPDGKNKSVVVEKCIAHLRKNALKQQGVFRKPGSAALVDEMATMFNNGMDVDFAKIGTDNTAEERNHAVASLLKRYMNDLPEPMFPFKCHDSLLKAKHSPETLQRVIHDRKLVPQKHYQTIGIVMSLLKSIADKENDNKMNAGNLATCVAPSMFQSDFERVEDAIAVLTGMLENYEKIFGDAFSPLPMKSSVQHADV